MKAFPSALLLGLLGLAIADEAAAPSGAASGSLPAILRIPVPLLLTGRLPILNSVPRAGFSAAAFAVGAAALLGGHATTGTVSAY